MKYLPVWVCAILVIDVVQAQPRTQETNAMNDHIVKDISFSFIYDGKTSETFLAQWPCRQKIQELSDGRTLTTTTWTDKKIGLSVLCETTRFGDFPAVDWLVRFRNDGQADTLIIENVHALDMTLNQPCAAGAFHLHKLNGSPANPSDFEPAEVVLGLNASCSLGAAGG